MREAQWPRNTLWLNYSGGRECGQSIRLELGLTPSQVQQFEQLRHRDHAEALRRQVLTADQKARFAAFDRHPDRE